MHEAGLAVAVAAEIKARRLDPGRVRVVVSGGHADPAAFDAALRAHLDATEPALGLGAVGIVHARVPNLCAGCASFFRAVEPAASCPSCGGPGMPLGGPESVELEWGEPDGDAAWAPLGEIGPPHDHGADEPDRPLADDRRLSPRVGAAPEASDMWRPVGPGRS